MRGIIRMSQSLFFFEGGGGREHIKFIVTQPKSVSSDPSFRPCHLKHSNPVGKKYHCVERYNAFTCYLQLSRKPRPAIVSVQRRTESHKKQSNTAQQNGTEMETIYKSSYEGVLLSYQRFLCQKVH